MKKEINLRTQLSSYDKIPTSFVVPDYIFNCNFLSVLHKFIIHIIIQIGINLTFFPFLFLKS